MLPPSSPIYAPIFYVIPPKYQISVNGLFRHASYINIEQILLLFGNVSHSFQVSALLSMNESGFYNMNSSFTLLLNVSPGDHKKVMTWQIVYKVNGSSINEPLITTSNQTIFDFVASFGGMHNNLLHRNFFI